MVVVINYWVFLSLMNNCKTVDILQACRQTSREFAVLITNSVSK